MRLNLEIPEFDYIKFLSRIIIIDDCWVFKGMNKNGYRAYGLKTIKGNYYCFRAHRLSYHIFNGVLEQGKVIDHMCSNKTCVNPEHLRQVTSKVNVTENSTSATAMNISKTQCPKGHEYSGHNLILRKVKKWTFRNCRTCNNTKQREYMKRKKETRKKRDEGVRREEAIAQLVKMGILLPEEKEEQDERKAS